MWCTLVVYTHCGVSQLHRWPLHLCIAWVGGGGYMAPIHRLPLHLCIASVGGRRVHGSNTQIAFTFVYWFGTGGACTQGGGIALVVSVDRHLKSLLCFPIGRQHRVVWPEYEAQTKHVMNGLPNAPKCLPIAAPLAPTHHPSPPHGTLILHHLFWKA